MTFRTRGAALVLAASVIGAGCAFVYAPSPESGPCATRAPLPLAARPTLGVHGLFDPAAARELGTKAVRLILSDDAIKAGFAVEDAGGTPAFATALQQLHADGVSVIVAIRWPVTPGVQGPGDLDRVPTGADRTASLDLLRRFLTETAGVVSWYQLQNEPVGGPGAYRPQDRGASIEWLRTLAETACTLRSQNPALEGLRLMSPGLTGIAARIGNHDPDPATTAYIDQLLHLADTHLEAVDVHLHVDQVPTAVAMLDWVKRRTTLPLVTMEWSQAKVATAWLGRPVADARFGTGTNRDFVEAAYQHHVSSQLWRAFVATSPHDPAFLGALMDALATERVQIACYGGANQYGQPLYDLDALYANATVGGRTPNEPFYSEFRALTPTA